MLIERSCLCGKVLQVEEHAGTSVHCPACGAVLPASAFVPALALDGPPTSKDEDEEEEDDTDEEDEEDEDATEVEDQEDDLKPVDGLATPMQLTTATMLAGPIAGAVLLTRNYWKMGNPWAASATVVGCVLLVLAAIWLAEDNAGQAQALVAGVWIGVALLAYVLQAGALRRNSEAGGSPATTGALVVVGLACVLVTIGLAFFPDLADDATVTFGEGESIGYRAPVTEDEARALGKQLQAVGIFDDTGETAVRLRHRRGAYEVSLVVQAGWNDPRQKRAAALLAGRISQQVFDGKPVRFRLCKKGFRAVTTMNSAP